MQRQVAGVIAATAVLVALLPATADGASAYTASCAAGGVTAATWQHAKVAQVTIEWVAPAGSGVSFDPLVVPNPKVTPPRGLISTATPSVNGVAPVSATLSFQQKDGTVATTTVACT